MIRVTMFMSFAMISMTVIMTLAVIRVTMSMIMTVAMMRMRTTAMTATQVAVRSTVVVETIWTNPVRDAADDFDGAACRKRGHGFIVVTVILLHNGSAAIHRDGAGYGDAARGDGAGGEGHQRSRKKSNEREFCEMFRHNCDGMDAVRLETRRLVN